MILQRFNGTEKSYSRENLICYSLRRRQMEGAQALHLRSPVTYKCFFGNLLDLVSKNKIEWESIPMSRSEHTVQIQQTPLLETL